MVKADVTGLAELAAEHPWGAVDWLCRMLTAMNLTWWGTLFTLALLVGIGALSIISLRRCRSPFAAFSPWLVAALFTLPVISLGDQVWMLIRPQFPLLHLVWFAILTTCLLAGRKGLIAFAALQLILIAVGKLCYYDLPVCETMRSAWALPSGPEWTLSNSFTIAIFIAFTALCFVRIPAEIPKWTHFVPIGLAIVLVFVALPKRNCLDQLKMERAVLEQRFDDVLKIAPDKARPERMETAWRILAMFRTERIDRDLYRFPIVGSHVNTDEEEMAMEGSLLLFHYGMILPARRWVFETAASFGAFPIWHKESDLFIVDLRSNRIRKLEEINSRETDSYHAFSSNGKWMVFSSRRLDGNHTRAFFTHFNADKGSFSKPFLIPVENPDEHNRRFRSYNIPEFSTGPVKYSPRELRKASMTGN